MKSLLILEEGEGEKLLKLLIFQHVLMNEYRSLALIRGVIKSRALGAKITGYPDFTLRSLDIFLAAVDHMIFSETAVQGDVEESRRFPSNGAPPHLCYAPTTPVS